MPHDRQPLASVCRIAVAFAALGALSRHTLRSTETRWQIAAFATAAVGIEIARHASGGRPSWLRAVVGAASAAVVITVVKFDVEPTARRHDAAIIRRGTREVFHEAKAKADS